jgi:hypothetical protein
MIDRGPRRLGDLLSYIDQVDRASLAEQRLITIPLLRRLLIKPNTIQAT